MCYKEDREFNLGCLEVYKCLSALWKVKSYEYSNNVKKDVKWRNSRRNT